MFIDRGRIVFASSMDAIEDYYCELSVGPESLAAARALQLIHERQVLGRGILLSDHVERRQLQNSARLGFPVSRTSSSR